MGIDRRVELSAHFGLYSDSLLCRRSAISNCGDDSMSTGGEITGDQRVALSVDTVRGLIVVSAQQ